MIMTRNTPPTAKHGDIVESELLDILQTVIEARCGLSAIHQLLDEAKTMSDIRIRFNQWQTEQRTVKLQQMDYASNHTLNKVKKTD
ncbi:MAG: hypothetical protein K8F26_08360 [Thiobacillus sp.]|jgi:hypothetical protein|nr:hypothetical protein [Thiobacillus sp.]